MADADIHGGRMIEEIKRDRRPSRWLAVLLVIVAWIPFIVAWRIISAGK